MLKKSLRLRSAEVEEVLKGGQSVRSAHMQLKWLPGEGHMRSAAVVAKALARKATARNTWRRAIYRAIAGTSPLSPALHGKAIFFLRVIPTERPNAVIKEEVALLLSKVK